MVNENNLEMAMTGKLVFVIEYCPSQYPKPDYQGTSPSGSPIIAQCNVGDPRSCRTGFSCQPSQGIPGTYYCCQQDYGCPGIYSSAQIDQNSNFPRGCGVQGGVGVMACANGYQCVYSSVQNQQICCSTLGGSGGGTTGNYCPNGGQVANLGGGPQTCTPFSQCPTGYSCQSGYCCTLQSQGYCPIGTNPALDSQGQPVACSPYTSCPSGYACTTDYGGSYCCSVNGGGGNPSGGQICPAGSQPYYLGNGLGNAKTCSYINDPSCPQGYSCQLGPSGQYYCCSNQNSGTSQYCPQGSNLQNGVPTPCLPSQSTCTYPYTCQNSGYSNDYFCCSSNSGTSQGICPYGSSQYPGTSNCNYVGSYCAPGYTCQQGAYGLACCSSNSGNPGNGNYCPAGSNPLYQPGGFNPESCLPGYPNSCGAGYSCQTTGYGAGGKSYCCSINGGTSSQYCPSGSSPWYYPGTNSPLSCVIGVSRCPGSSTCQCPYGPGSYGTRGYCCTGANECPAGKIPLVQNGALVTCNPNYATSTCGYYGTCQYSASRRCYFCCTIDSIGGSTGSGGSTGQNTEPTTDPYCPTAIVGVTCSPGSTMCSAYGNFVCQFNTAKQQYRCCSSYQGKKKK